eukprot:3459730-Rhodomonas_salina.1
MQRLKPASAAAAQGRSKRAQRGTASPQQASRWRVEFERQKKRKEKKRKEKKRTQGTDQAGA